MNIFRQKTYAKDLWKVLGSFGELTAEVECKENTFSSQNDKISLIAKIEKGKDGVFSRNDILKNISSEPLSINTLSSKFTLDGGEYEVYTQYNVWKNESKGTWQPLVTSVSAYTESIRNASGATPFMVIWSKQHSRGVAFHINAYSAWEMKVTRNYIGGEASAIEVELGVLSDGLNLTLKPGEEIDFPEIIYYDIFNKLDMDSWRLHNYLNDKYPRRELPVIYNTWLYKFDRFSYDDILKQVEKAEELGVEYFVIDAGWFGDGANWWGNRGDWEENLTFGFEGRMCEIADEVRNHGMKFGFWIEPECAAETSEIYKAHPDYFLKGSGSYFIDFANKEANDYIFNKTCELVERYGAEFLKFDFNADLKFDKYKSGFIKYAKGHAKYIEKLKEKYPTLFVENCGAGGMRSTVREGRLYDAFWMTDDQSPYCGLDNFRDSVLRVPPQWQECVFSIYSAEKFYYKYGTTEKEDKLFSTNDQMWNAIASVDMNFLKGFMTGRPLCMSFDLTSLTPDVFGELKEFIADFKADREFWHDAACHIITDTETMLVFEFRNSDFSRVELVVFSKKAIQKNICVYPVLNSNLKYTLKANDDITSEDVFEKGIDFPIKSNYSCRFATLIGK